MKRVCSDHWGGSLHADRLGHVLSWLGLGGLLLCELVEEVGAGGLEVESGGVQPWVGLELLQGWSLVTVIAEESQDEVLEVGGEASAVDLLEVGVVLALEEEVVEVLLLSGLLEWEDALDDDEEDPLQC